MNRNLSLVHVWHQSGKQISSINKVFQPDCRPTSVIHVGNVCCGTEYFENLWQTQYLCVIYNMYPSFPAILRGRETDKVRRKSRNFSNSANNTSRPTSIFLHNIKTNNLKCIILAHITSLDQWYKQYLTVIVVGRSRMERKNGTKLLSSSSPHSFIL